MIVETVLTESEIFADVGIEFTAISELDIKPDETSYPTEFEFEDWTYLIIV